MRISDWSSDVCSSDLAGDDCYSLDFRQVEIGNGQRQRLIDALEIGTQGLGDDDRLLVNLLDHIMAVIALGDQLAIDTRLGDRAFDRLVGLIVNLYLVAAAADPVAFFEIDDPLGQRGKGKRVRAKIGLPLPKPYNQRQAQPRAD